MAAKRSRRRLSSKQHRMWSWQRVLLLLVMMPLGVGLLLIVTALAGAVVWGAPREQVMMGGFYILFSFVASNAIQKQWELVAGWTSLGAATWLMLNRPEMWAKVAAAAFMGVGVALLSREFLRRRRQYLDAKKR